MSTLTTITTEGAARSICGQALLSIYEGVKKLDARKLLPKEEYLPNSFGWYETKLNAAAEIAAFGEIKEAVDITLEWQNYFNDFLNILSKGGAA